MVKVKSGPKYAVKYQLSGRHTGRLHRTIRAALRDRAACLRAQTDDYQRIDIVRTDGLSLTDDECREIDR